MEKLAYWFMRASEIYELQASEIQELKTSEIY